jgi:hypothetical protein
MLLGLFPDIEGACDAIFGCLKTWVEPTVCTSVACMLWNRIREPHLWNISRGSSYLKNVWEGGSYVNPCGYLRTSCGSYWYWLQCSRVSGKLYWRAQDCLSVSRDKTRIMLCTKKGLLWPAVYWSQLGIMWNRRLTWILQLEDKVMKMPVKSFGPLEACWIHTMHGYALTLNVVCI